MEGATLNLQGLNYKTVRDSDGEVNYPMGIQPGDTMMKRQISTYLVTALTATFTLPVQSAEVVLWNRLGSDAEVAASEIGPGGTKHSGSYTPGPFASFGNAYMNSTPNVDSTLSFPANSVVSKSKGTIAFWAKLNNFPSALFDSIAPLHYVTTWKHPQFHWRVGFGSNNGCGGSGFYGTAGVATDSICHGLADTATQGGTLDSILGDRAAWHHYAIVWNEAGIAQLGGRKVYLYLDGDLKTTPHYQDRSPWGDIPSGSRFALALFSNITGPRSVAVDNLIVWDDVKTDFSDRFNENPVGQMFSTLIPRAILNMGPKAHDDTFHVSAKFGLGTDSDGIDPVNEKVGIQFGSFKAIIPPGSFEQTGPLYRFSGTINKTDLDVMIHVPQKTSPIGIASQWSTPTDYWFKIKAKNANLNGTVLPPELQFTVGDDMGNATLNVGQAKFGKGKDDEKWLKGGD